MEQYRCRPCDLPHTLWRVQYPDSRTLFDLDQGLLAADTETWTHHPLALASIARDSFNWSSGFDSPFINCFSDEAFAYNWAFKHSRHNGGYECRIFEIDTSELYDTYVYRLFYLCQQLNITLPDRAALHEEGAYLCLHEIPLKAITNVVVCQQNPDRGRRKSRQHAWVDDDLMEAIYSAYDGSDEYYSGIEEDYEEEYVDEDEVVYDYQVGCAYDPGYGHYQQY